MTSSEPALPRIRAATLEDAEPLARCQLSCWREAYTGMVDPERLAQVLSAVEERLARWREMLTGASGRLLAEEAGAVVGFAAAGPPRAAGLDLSTELYALYVRQSRWGTGLGHRLLEAAIGDTDCVLWVFHDNSRARRFYTRHGFAPDGTEARDDYFGGVEIRMRRSPTGP